MSRIYYYAVAYDTATGRWTVVSPDGVQFIPVDFVHDGEVFNKDTENWERIQGTDLVEDEELLYDYDVKQEMIEDLLEDLNSESGAEEDSEEDEW